jgi:transcriptional regulator with XRE-family HTH domain
MPDIQRITIVKNYFNLSQKELSLRIGISPSKVSKVESGSQKISAEMVFAINKEFNVSMEWLLGNIGYSSKIMFSNDFVPKEELEKERREKEAEQKKVTLLQEKIIEYQNEKLEKQSERIREQQLHK